MFVLNPVFGYHPAVPSLAEFFVAGSVFTILFIGAVICLFTAFYELSDEADVTKAIVFGVCCGCCVFGCVVLGVYYGGWLFV